MASKRNALIGTNFTERTNRAAHRRERRGPLTRGPASCDHDSAIHPFPALVVPLPLITVGLERALRLFVGVVAMLVAAYEARHFAIDAYLEYGNFHPPRLEPVVPSDSEALRLAAVWFRDSEGVPLYGWFLPGRNRAAVVLAHGGGENRAQMLPIARSLQHHGFGVLLFDWPGHGASAGNVEYGASERRALVAAIDLLAKRPDVAADRIGVYGFSLGGFVSLQVAATNPRIAALAVLAAPTDLLGHLKYEYRRSGAAGRWGANLMIRLQGGDVTAAQPRDIVARIAPRPLLVINGERDETISPDMARELFLRAKEPKELWLIPGVGHHEVVGGDAARAARLCDFFERALTSHG